MPATLTLLHILGAVALLLWGIGMVRRTITKLFGARLRRFLAEAGGNPLRGAFSGMGTAMLLQSSTAAIIIIASFAAKGYIAGGSGLAMALGADLGTTLVAQVLRFDLGWLAPLFLLTGAVFHAVSSKGGKAQPVFAIVFGLGLMLLSLSLIRAQVAPLAESETLRTVLNALASEPILAFLLAAALTWLAHSSLAVVLIIASFAASGILTPPSIIALVLGANLGSTLPALIAAWHTGNKGRVVPLGNLALRGALAGIGLSAAIPLGNWLGATELQPETWTVHLHMAFNLILVLFALPFTPWIARTLERHLPPGPDGAADYRPRYLDNDALDTPTVALAGAARETLRMAEIAEAMLRDALPAILYGDLNAVRRVKSEDDRLDRLYDAIKHYMARLSEERLQLAEGQRAVQILTFTLNIEHIGDIITKNLMPIAEKKARSEAQFSQAGWDEIEKFHEQVLENLQLVQSIFLSGDSDLARQLVDSKTDLRVVERRAAQAHLARLREGLPETLSSTGLHMDILRDLRRINSYAAAVAYDILNRNELEAVSPTESR